jgi:peptide deformylase
MRELLVAPNTLLRQPCEPVAKIDSYIRDLVHDLLDLVERINIPEMRTYGIAAPQVGELVQLFVLSTPAVTLVALNPVIVKTHGQHDWIEACLSLPGSFYKVCRPKLIKFQYLGLDGQIHAGKFHDDFAGVCQHEIQHLSGVMIDALGRSVSRELIYRA